MSMYVIDGGRDETLTEAVGRRFREQLAGRNITRREVARRLQKSEPWVGRRAAGQTPFTTDDLESIEAVTGISAMYLITGLNAENRRPTMSDGGSKYTPRESNPEPTGYRPVSESNVVALTPASTGDEAAELDQPADVVDIEAVRTAAVKSGSVLA